MKRYSAQIVGSLVLALVLLLVSGRNASAQEAFSATAGNNPGEVTLTWKKSASDITNYHVVYGPQNNKSQFSALNIGGGVLVGKQVSFTVSFLNPNAQYYFSLSSVKGQIALPAGPAISALSKGGVVKLPVSASTAQASAVASSLTTVVTGDKINNQSKSNIASNDVGLHHLSVKKGVSGEVILSWKKAYKDVNNYDIVYGTEPGKLQYGAQNLGDITSFAVKSLDPKKQYYFALVPKKGKEAQYITAQASTANAPAATHEEIKVSAGQPVETQPQTASNSNGSSNSTNANVNAAIPAQTIINTVTTGTTNKTTNGGGSSNANVNSNSGSNGFGTTNSGNGGTKGGTSVTTNSNSINTPAKGPSKAVSPEKKEKDKSVKGIETSNFNLLDFVKALFGL